MYPMPEHDQPGEEDQGFTLPDLGAEDSDSEEVEDEDEERTPAQKMRDFKSLIELGDLKSIEGHLEFWTTIIDGDGKGPEDTIQTPLEESEYPPEVVEALKSHRKILEDARQAIQRNVDVIKAAIAEAAPAQKAHDIERRTAELEKRKAELEAYRAKPESERSAHDMRLLENQVRFAEENLEKARGRE